MKHFNKLAMGLVLTGIMTQSCKKDFQEANTNPQALNDTKPEFLFTAATMDYSMAGRSMLISKYGSSLRYMQYITPDVVDKDAMEGAFCDPGKTTFPSPSGSFYSDYFTSTGRDYNRIIAKIDKMEDGAVKKGYANLRYVCEIMNTYDAWKVSDIYGGLPYSQAFKVTEFPTPKFDFGWDLYKSFDNTLKAAVVALSATVDAEQIPFVKQDFFYNGDKDKWIRFANTLRIKIAQRYEKRDAAHLAAVLTDIATNFGGKIISKQDESFGYTNTRDWNNNIDDIDGIQNGYVASFAFVEFLRSTNDPRLPLLVRQNDWGTNYAGYNDVKANGTAAAKATLDSAAVNYSRYVGKHVFSASASAPYGWEGQTKTKQFTVTSGTGTATRTLSYISLINTRLFVKNGGFKVGNPSLHLDETVVDGGTIPMRTNLLNYAEACFMMAEIAAKGGNGLGKSAAQWYNDGVTASFDFYKQKGISQNLPGAADAVLGDFLIRYPYAGLASIYSQAWVNYLTQPEESWAMWKRTGYPQFDDYRAGAANKIGDGSGIAYLENLFNGSTNLTIPRRYILPVTTVQMAGSLEAAINDMKSKDAAYGNDRLDSRGRIWWDKQ
ncbi:SusD/RagB family nutrient-binding outer membrane lipoprotein [Chitinophaga sp. NPDC101104]|uniref:SusD/RagB family nutrient-binding outer membrane lipoprotein n=1 Tax=Chitinophaga sp. NPDC101104 TaxID=3390561 RepID=UPI003D0302C9